jgi:hypothetical protein
MLPEIQPGAYVNLASQEQSAKVDCSYCKWAGKVHVDNSYKLLNFRKSDECCGCSSAGRVRIVRPAFRAAAG